MSNLLVQNIKHTNNTTSMSIDTSGQVSVRGESSATTTNLQQGLAKCWCQFDSDVTFADTFNVASGTDNGTGNYTFTITNDMSNTGYSCSLTAQTGADKFLGAATLATGSIIVEMFTANSGANVNGTTMATVHGDLA